MRLLDQLLHRQPKTLPEGEMALIPAFGREPKPWDSRMETETMFMTVEGTVVNDETGTPMVFGKEQR